MSARATQLAVNTAECIGHACPSIAAALAIALLLSLSWCSGVHSPLFDGIRYGTCLLRSRRGAMVPILRLESPIDWLAPSFLVAPNVAKESHHARSQ